MTADFGGGPPHEPVPPASPTIMQPKYLAGLVLGAVVVLIAGIAVFASRGGNDDGGASATTVAVTVPRTTSPIIPATTSTTTSTSSTSTTSTTSTTTTTSSSTLPPEPAVANAGEDRSVDAGTETTLTAIELSEPNQSIVWRQITGVDVLDGRPQVLGNDIAITMPDRPTTLTFEVTVTGRGGDVVTDDVRIDVFEDADDAVFVDGERGDDGSDGARATPFQSLARALEATSGRATDIYVRSIDGSYGTGGFGLDDGSSLYGGYDAEWRRNISQRANIVGRDEGLLVSGSNRTVVSAVNLFASDASDGLPSIGLVAEGTTQFVLEHSEVRAGNASSGASVGLSLETVATATIFDSVVAAGASGDGADGDAATSDGEPGATGATAPADPPTSGSGGGNGSSGGEGGLGLEAGDDGSGERGGKGGDIRQDGGAGEGGPGGLGGAGGSGGQNVDGSSRNGANGEPGAPGGDALGGGGGGGGGGLILHDGGGGGGGGGGGLGGRPGAAGRGGFGSVGLAAIGVDTLQIIDSTILGGSAGSGGAGGEGARGSNGGGGGGGAEGISTFVDTAADGGGGGGGGAGGQGGQGGAGGGGGSFGLRTRDVGAAEVTNSTIRAGTGGDGGPGGVGGLPGDNGSGGAGRLGGGGGSGLNSDGARGGSGVPASGGAAIGWWDDGNTARTIADADLQGGTSGQPGGAGGAAGRSAATSF